MSQTKVFSLKEYPVHLGLGATVIQEPPFTGGEWYEGYDQRHRNDGVEGRLVSMHTFEKPWDCWEIHPKGAELVVCVEGEMTIHQEIDGKIETVHLSVGQAVINPPGVWHTADCSARCTALFITAGEGTENRPR